MSNPKPKNGQLSKRAASVLDRMNRGHFYAWSPTPGPAIRELIDSGLVETTARVETIRAAYVPTGSGDPYWTLKSDWRAIITAPDTDETVLLLLEDGRQVSGKRSGVYGGRLGYDTGFRTRGGGEIIVFPAFWRPALPMPTGYAMEDGRIIETNKEPSE